MSELQKLLRQNISIPQLLGYAFAALTGMSIIFSAFCLSLDIRPLFSSETGLFKKELMVVNKKVRLLSTFNSSQTTFSSSEIDEIRQQDFVRSLSYFSSSRFHVKAYMESTGQMPYFSTDLFFESVPDHLLDVNVAEWKWDEESRLIPIIIPRDYLSLYNFGFAGSQGLPQISEGIIRQVVFRVSLTGNGMRENFSGRIVGFSDHLNTILVPEAFMAWANDRFGDHAPAEKISRLVIEVKNPADPEVATFFAAHPGYEISSNKGEQGKLSYFLTLLIIIIMTVGCLIMIPAIGLMMLSINLLIYKNQKTLGNLILLGFPRKKLAAPYNMLVLGLNVLIGTVSILITKYIQVLYHTKLSVLVPNEQGSVFWMTLLFAIIFVCAISGLDILWIQRKITRIKIPARG
ncbi:MAG: ABC transporter permease [Bacteroidales bacterium]|jgi:hypothetical protein|nr:ABC transporter permease [Bacteroidales bacterium]